MDNAGLIAGFELNREVYNSFSQTISSLISRLLRADGVVIHSVSHRCKTLASLKTKVDKKNTYSDLGQITDLAGIRLITHYEDDVDRVAAIIESEFLIDESNSIDKRKALDPDRFGYLSLHYVVSLKPDRTDLKEYSSYSGLKAEVQVRSILQHTWAEIEHDTGYKSNVEVPKHIRRRFSRLAGLLELADQEFIGIRTALSEYAQEITAQLERNPNGDESISDVLIDKVSLKKFIEIDPLVSSLDQEISTILSAKCGADMEHALDDVKRLKLVGIESLAQLKKALKENTFHIISRAKFIANEGGLDISGDMELRFAISVLYLLQVLAAKSGDINAVDVILKKMGFGLSDGASLAGELKQLVSS